MDYEKKYNEALDTARALKTTLNQDVLEQIFPELAESEDENLKNKSGYYKDGKFWKASTLWNATRNKIPQRVSNRYILQECTWNIGTLQRFANEVKNVQEVSLDYPIILDMNGNILDGAHRVVKAYLEGKDIDIVYLGDDEWPEPDYDEEKAVRESEDERIRKFLIQHISEWIGCIKQDLKNSSKDIESEKELAMFKAGLAYLEKQKESLPISEMCKENANSFADGIIEVRSFQRGMEEGRRLERQKEQKPIECIEFDNEFEKQVSHLLASVLNGEWEYNEDFVKYAAQSLLGFAKNEMKPDEWDKREKLFRKALQAANARIGQLFEENQKLKEQKLEKYAQRLQKEQKPLTDEEKEYIRTIKSIISDFIRDKKPENLAYYQRIYDWLDGRHVPFSCGHENGKQADPVFSKQEYESYPIISKDTTSTKPVEFDGKTLLYTADKSYQIGFKDGVASVKPAEWNEEDEKVLCEIIQNINAYDAYTGTTYKQIEHHNKKIKWLEFLRSKQNAEWSENDEQMFNVLRSMIHGTFVVKTQEFLDELLSWLKSLKGRIRPQSKQEWSEEDEKDVAHIIRVLDDCYAYGKHDLSKTDHENLVGTLKSLRPQSKIHYWTEEEIEPIISDYLTGKEHYGGMIARLRCLKPKSSWKPSEEQMEALKNSAYGAYQNGDGPALRELYEQLKNL